MSKEVTKVSGSKYNLCGAPWDRFEQNALFSQYSFNIQLALTQKNLQATVLLLHLMPAAGNISYSNHSSRLHETSSAFTLMTLLSPLEFGLSSQPCFPSLFHICGRCGHAQLADQEDCS